MKNIKDIINIKNMRNIKDIINTILRGYCSIIIILAFLFIGSPLRNNFILVNIAIYIMAIIYILTNPEKKIFSRKLDVLICIFCHSLIIPIIFGTEIKTEDTINNLLNNISVFWMYIVIKNLFITEKQKNILLSTSLLGGIFLIILGIDNLTTRYIWNMGNKYFDFINTMNTDIRLISSLGYANSLAAVLSFNLFISWGLYLKNRNTLYIACIFIFLNGLLLTNSRAMLLIVAIFFIFVLILLRKKEIIIESIIIFGISTLLGFVYQKLFSDLQEENNYIIIWALFIIFTVFICILKIVLKYVINLILKIDNKKIIIFGILIIIFLASIFSVALSMKEPLILYKFINNIERRIYGILPNTEYYLEFDIESIAKKNSNNTYKIKIFEKNKYNDVIKTHFIEFDSIKETKTLEIITTDKTNSFWIHFCGDTQSAEKLIINSLKINGRDRALEYKWLPIKLIERLEALISQNRSTSERITFIKDGIKIIQKTWLFGAGSNCWQKYYPEVQEYKYSANQAHCCPEKIWMESGIVGFISYIGIIVIISTMVIKHRRELHVLFICLAILLIHIHGFVDFDLAFKFIYLISIALIGLTNIEEIKVKEKRKKFNIIWVLVLAICYFYSILNYKLENTNNFSYSERELYLKLCPYNERLLQIRNNAMLNQRTLSEEDSLKIRNSIKKEYTFTSNKLKKLIQKAPTNENIKFAYQQMKEYQKRQILNLQEKNQLNQEILLIARTLKDSEYKIKFCKLILDYKEKNLEEILDKDRNRYENKVIKEYEKKFKDIVNQAEKTITNTLK